MNIVHKALTRYTAQKLEFSSKDFSSKNDQIRGKLSQINASMRKENCVKYSVLNLFYSMYNNLPF